MGKFVNRTTASLALILSLPAASIAQQPAERVFFGVMAPASPVSGKGAPVGRVVPGGTAAAIGLRQGDLITSVNGTSVDSPDTMINLIGQLRVGEQITLIVQREGKDVTLRGKSLGTGAVRRGPVAAPSSPSDLRSIVSSLADEIEKRYVFPDVAVKYAAMLRANVANGVYDKLGSDEALAQRITSDLQSVRQDRHLELVPLQVSVEADGRVTVRSGRASAVQSDPIEKMERLTPDIAYIRLGFMSRDEEFREKVTGFLKANADAKTIIFDLRTARGGSPVPGEAFLSYFFDAPTTIFMSDIRKNVFEAITAAGETLMAPNDRRIEGPQNFVRLERIIAPSTDETRLRKAKLFVLTSPVTGSASEAFAFALRRTDRATLIGENTAGRGNFGRVAELGGAFRIIIPHGRPFDPATNEGWEGTGVEPTIRVPAEQALTEALVRSGVSRARAAELSASVAPDPAAMQPSRQSLPQVRS